MSKLDSKPRSNLEAISFDIEKPPLCVSIKNILNDYPSGQVFKEIIQNADDACATEVKFYLDSRHDFSTLIPKDSVSESDDDERACYHSLDRFKGQALIAYNNAAFTEKDWRGIKKLQNSEKAKDPHKVGKFGIGFNSVYHITDLPVIISGDFCAYLDPQEKIWKGESGKMFRLKEMESSCPKCLLPFRDIEEFSGSSFSGKTMFRFPLRNEKSDLSDTVCTINEIKELVEVLKAEANFLLLFLRSVCSIEIIEISDPVDRPLNASAHFDQKRIFKVAVSPKDFKSHLIRQEQLATQIQEHFPAPQNFSNHVICQKSKFSIEITNDIETQTHNWLVVQRIGTEDDEVLALAKKQYLLPYVGTAYEISNPIPISSGRIYCFLPLPNEERVPFSVSVNGTFAMSSNRRSLNWESQERQNDIESKWNRFLVERCIPQCYAELIQELVTSCSTSITPDVVYHCWPSISCVKNTGWEGMLRPLFQEMLYSSSVVYARVKPDSKWISLADAVVVPENTVLSDTVEEVLCSAGIKQVSLPSTQWEALKDYYNPCDQAALKKITPHLVRNVLTKNESVYRWLSPNNKLDLLAYCLSDKCYSDLNGLELIPLANGSFEKFRESQQSAAVFLCSPSIQHTLLPGLEHKVVDDSHSSLLKEVATSPKTQLVNVTETVIAELILQSKPLSWSEDQLRIFWNWVKNYKLTIFNNVPIVPIVNASGEQSMHNPNKLSRIVLVPQGKTIEYDLRTGLEKCGVRFLFISDDISHHQLPSLMYSLEVKNVLDAMINKHAISDIKFSYAESAALEEFLNLLHTVTVAQWNTICAMAIFPAVQDKKLYSINEATRDTKTYHNKALLQDQKFCLDDKLLLHRPLVFQTDHPFLRKIISSGYIKCFNEVEYLKEVIFPTIRNKSYPQHFLHELMISVLHNIYFYKHLCSNSPFTESFFLNSLSELYFVTVKNGDCKPPSSLFDPEDEILTRLYKGKPVFPSGEFMQYIEELRLCGLKGFSSITAEMLYDIAVDIIKTNKQVGQTNSDTFERALTLMEVLDRKNMLLNEVISVHYRQSSLVDELCQLAKNHALLPVAYSAPDDYPSSLSWKGSLYEDSLTNFDVSTGNVIAVHDINAQQSMYLIIGSEAVFIDNVPSLICQRLMHDAGNSPTACVVKHFKQVIQQHMSGSLDRETLQKISLLTYEYLNRVDRQFRKTNLWPENWVWVKSCSTFQNPKVCAMSPNASFGKNSLEPYFFILQKSMEKYKTFLCHHGVHSVITNEQIISVLSSIKSKSSDIRVNADNAWILVKNILEWIAKNKIESENILVPIESQEDFPDLRPIRQVSYTDNEILLEIAKSSDDEYSLVHPNVAHLAQQLNLTPLSDQLEITEEVFMDAGQHEPLTTRLRNILKDYKDGLTIIKEMIQNADDAKATEVNILYDAREHTKERLFFKGMADSHGPALVIHNNAIFTEDDFSNITKLAGATKKDKPLKIGKFGVGFCSVYHITDVPSFVSGDWLYIFDPTLSHLKEVIKNRDQPGKKVKYMSKVIKKTNQLAPYQKLFAFDSTSKYDGTMFRLPFRNDSSQISSTIYDRTTVDQLKKELEENGQKLLLFLNHVEKIRFFSIPSNGHFEIQNSEITIEKTVLLKTDEKQFLQIDTTIKKFQNQETTSENWLICTDNQQQNGQPAIASVACQLHPTNGSDQYEVIPVDGIVFCYLPLPVRSGLPVHVNANFAVMSSRNGIWTSSQSKARLDSQDECKWNELLMRTVIKEAYGKLLLKLKDGQQKHKLSNYQFYSLLPLIDELSTKNPWQIMIKELFQKLTSETLFFSKFSGNWINLQQSKFLSPSILSFQSESTPECVIDALFVLRHSVVDIPSPYLNQLRSIVGTACTVTIFNQTMFCSMFMKQISSFTDEYAMRNKVLFNMFVTAASQIAADKMSDLTDILKQNPYIPVSPNGVSVELATKLVDPQSHLKIFFEEHSEMFPHPRFSERQAVHRLMIDIGLLTTRLPWELVLERAKLVSKVYRTNKQRAIQQVQILINVIEQNIENSEDKLSLCCIDELKRTEFIPVAAKPAGMILPWKGEDIIFAAPCKTFHPSHLSHNRKVDYCLLGSQKLIINNVVDGEGAGCGEIPSNILEALGIEIKRSFDDVLSNYKCLITAFQNTTLSTTVIDENVVKNVEMICRLTYEFFDDEIKSKSGQQQAKIKERLSLFHNKPFVWSGRCFICPQNIALKWKEAGPCLHGIPQLISERKRLLETLLITEHFSIRKLLCTFKEIHNKIQENEAPEQYRSIIDAIINELNNYKLADFKNYIELHTNENIILPSSHYILCTSRELSFNDSPWLPMDKDSVLVHTNLNRDIALELRVEAVRSKYLKQYSTVSAKFGGIPFGQKPEELTDRIKNILRNYPCDATLLKELLQNADDAKATKFHVILDKRKHGDEKVLSPEWSKLQGPALLVWNDKEFEKKDFEGIQEIGIGSKRDDPETIGQFGIGFNVVYHITDCPSLISGGTTLCVFDPHCKYVPEACVDNPGMRYDSLKEEFWDSIPDMRDPYLLGKEVTNQPHTFCHGTLFRFPLRSTLSLVQESKIVEDSTFNAVLNANKLEKKLDDWVPQIKEALIFLNHITEFSYYTIEEEFNCKARYTISMNNDAQESRAKFLKATQAFATEKQALPETFPYQIHIEGLENIHEDWLVQQGVGDTNEPTRQWHFAKKLPPKHGIAAPVHVTGTTESRFAGKIFCFLPLPGISGLPVHINGQFFLNSDRRSLWTGDDETDERKKWNDSLINAIASSYVQLLDKARFVIVEDNKTNVYKHIKLQQYYELFPFWLKEKINLDANSQTLAQLVFKKLWLGNCQILAVVDVYDKKEQNQSKRVNWNCLKNRKSFEQAHFLPFYDSNEAREKLVLVLKSIKMKVTCAPYKLHKHLLTTCTTDDLKHLLITPTSVFEFYCEFYRKIFELHSCCLPCHIKKTPFQNIETLNYFLHYTCTLTSEDGTYTFSKPPFKYPLLLTADGFLRFFDADKKVIRTKYYNLFQKSLANFLHSEALCTLSPLYFIKTSEIQCSKLNELFEENYPKELRHPECCDNSNCSVIEHESLKNLWNCMLDEKDNFLFQHISNMLLSWALIPATNGWLYSRSCKVLPIMSPDISAIQNDKEFEIEVFTVLKEFGFPVLDVSYFPDSTMPDAIKHCIPAVTDYDRILDILVHLHTHKNALNTLSPESDEIKILLKYLSPAMSLSTQSKTKIMSLPLFTTIDGRHLTNLLNKKVYCWPGCWQKWDLCIFGYKKWAPQDKVIFLTGNWNILTSDFSDIGTKLSETEIYLQLILPVFSELSSDEKHQHLLHIRNSSSVVRTSSGKIESFRLLLGYSSNYLANKANDEALKRFLDVLKITKCIECPKTNKLRAISEFSDHTIDIYKYFPDDYYFLPEKYHDEKWLVFFHNLGLKVDVSLNEFIGFCQKVELGDSTEIRKASSVLLKYLCDEGLQKWNTDVNLQQIATINFILVHDVSKLSWIKEPCTSHVVRTGNITAINLTSLKKAVAAKHDSLVWTVKPVIELPFSYMQTNCLAEALRITMTPSPNDVLQNLMNISNSGLSNSDLLFKYEPQYVVKEGTKNKTHVIDVFKNAISFLQKSEYNQGQGCVPCIVPSVSLLSKLKEYACIPVSADPTTKEDIPSKVVLVKPMSVVAKLAVNQTDQSLLPYINEVPNCLKPLLRSLEEIGVAETIQVSHLQFLLETLHERINGVGTIDPNEHKVFRCCIIKLQELLSSHLKSEEHILKSHLAPLYLPSKEAGNHRWYLKKSDKLLFADGLRYSCTDTKYFKFQNTKHGGLFQIPPPVINVVGIAIHHDVNESKFCSFLPKEIRPHPLSLYAVEKKMASGNTCSNGSFLKSCLLQMLNFLGKMNEIFLKIVECKAHELAKPSANIATKLLFILKNLKIEVIDELQAEVHIDTVEIGILRSPNFVLEKKADTYELYLSKSAQPEYSVWKELSKYILMELAVLLKMQRHDFLCLTDPLMQCLQVQSEDSLIELANKLKIEIKSSNKAAGWPTDDTKLEPKVGRTVPDEFFKFLEVSIDNIYYPEEWVGYEIKDDPSIIIWAIIIHPIQENHLEVEENHLRQYKVLTSEENREGIVVSALELFKLVPVHIKKHNKAFNKPSSDLKKAVTVYRQGSPLPSCSNDRKKVEFTSSEIIALKKKVYEDLEKVWKIPDKKIKERGIRRLRGLYHPDRHPGKEKVYEEAFKFLCTQVERLEKGQPMEDPTQENSQPDSQASWVGHDDRPDVSCKWKGEAPRWFSWQNDRSRDEEISQIIFDKLVVKPSPEEADRWLRQAETDCKAMQVLRTAMNTSQSHVCQVILLAHEAIEKSLKAGMYALFGLNRSDLMTHKLVNNAESICSKKRNGLALTCAGNTTKSLVDIAEKISPYYTTVRYPNEHEQFKAPVDVYSIIQAEEAAKFAEIVIQFIKPVVKAVAKKDI